MNRSVWLLLAMTLSSVSVGYAAEAGQNKVTNNKEEPEEIIIRGTKTALSLRVKMMDTELRIYDLFNALNTDDRYDIHCQVTASTGSLIKQRQCSAQFADDVRADEAWAYESDIPWIAPMDEVERHNKEFKRLLEKYLKESKDLLSVAREYRDLRKQVVDAEKALEKN